MIEFIVLFSSSDPEAAEAWEGSNSEWTPAPDASPDLIDLRDDQSHHSTPDEPEDPFGKYIYIYDLMIYVYNLICTHLFNSIKKNLSYYFSSDAEAGSNSGWTPAPDAPDLIDLRDNESPDLQPSRPTAAAAAYPDNGAETEVNLITFD